MANQLYFEASDKKYHESFFNKDFVFEIPRYQRHYSWSVDQINELWDDLNSEHPGFFGAFMLNRCRIEKEKTIEVIDGQQRLLTITMLIAIIRDLLYEYSEEFKDESLKDLSELYHKEAIGKPMHDEKGTITYKYYVKPSESFEEVYKIYVQDRGNDISGAIVGKRESESYLLQKNYLLLKKKILNELIGSDKNKNSIKVKLASLYTKIKNLVIVQIEIEDETQAYEYFETVNARGLDLSVADLVKNQIFRQVKPGTTDIAKEIWTDILQNIEQANTSMKEFLRHHWASKYEYVPDRRLYIGIKQKFGQNKKKWEDFLMELHDSSEIYKDLINGEKSQLLKWIQDKNETAKLYQSLRPIRYTKAKTWTVIYLCFLRNYSKIPIDLTKFFKRFERFIFMYYTVLDYPGNWFFNRMYSFAQDIEDLVKTQISKEKFNQLIKNLEKGFHSQMPMKDEFKKAFVEIKYKDNPDGRGQIRYVLDEIENHNGFRAEGYNEENVSIEHILPQDPQKWGLIKNDVKDFVDKIGNLLLVTKEQNGQMQNKIISEKLKILNKSNFTLAKELVKKIKNKHWDFKAIEDKNFEAIEKRGNRLAGIAHKIWVEENFKAMGF